MSPATQHEVWTTEAGSWTLPLDPSADDSRISWTRCARELPDSWPGTADLLDDFCELERAQPDEMASFIAKYGMPEVKIGEVHGAKGWVSVTDLREHARALAAARRLGAALMVRRPGEAEDWLLLQGVGIHLRLEELDDWKLGRERLAYWLTALFRETNIGTGVEWRGSRGLALDPTPDTLLGVIALLLAREVGAEGQYECSSCGAGVHRVRPPREGEQVYCDRPECKREQKRRNQAAWRAKKAKEVSD